MWKIKEGYWVITSTYRKQIETQISVKFLFNSQLENDWKIENTRAKNLAEKQIVYCDVWFMLLELWFNHIKFIFKFTYAKPSVLSRQRSYYTVAVSKIYY